MNHPKVSLDCGTLQGVAREDHLGFQGIPYAAPPRGRLRWAPPQPPIPWSGVRDATAPGSPAPQVGSVYASLPSLDEDCLFLNVTTPKTQADPRPVMVWIHGDGAIGSGDLFPAARLAADGDVVVVTFNYRLGVFGAFGHPALPDSGTFGLQDQRAALEWVRDNISAFGGDPGNVTLFGVSFGATAAVAHLVSPASRGLFHKLILHSGFAVMDAPAGALYPQLPALEWFGWKSQEELAALGAAMAPELGCPDPATALECLRAKPVKEILDHPAIMNIFQAYAFGGEVLPSVPLDALREGRFEAVPIMAGGTRDEHRTFAAIRELSGFPVTEADYPAVLAQAFGDRAAQVAERYPLGDYDSAAVAFCAVMTDRMWASATHRQNRLLAAKAPLYFFEFADDRTPSEFPFPEGLPPGAYHNADIGYLFRSRQFEAKMSPPQRRLSDDMIGYWTRFARSGDPNTATAPRWEPFGDNGYVQSLAPGEGGIAQVDYASEHRLEFWAGLEK